MLTCLTRSSSVVTMTQRMMSSMVAAVGQMTVTSDIESNLSQASQLVAQAKQRGAGMVFLPEACDYIGDNRQQTLELAQSLDGNTVTQFRKIASDNGVWLSLGGIHTKSKGDSQRISNSHLVISSSRDIIASYDKTHLFDVNIPGSVSLNESSYVVAGASITPPVLTPLGQLGLGVCYDLRFPEHSIALTRAGAHILTFPSAFTVKTGMAHWESLLRARAIETQCYVIAAAQVGQHNAKRSSYGHSMIVDPWGVVIAQCGEGVGVATATIDLDYLTRVRANMPVQSHRRHDLYPAINIAATDTDMGPPSTDMSLPSASDVFQFGPVTVPGPAVFMVSPLSSAFVNKKPVVDGHVLVCPNTVVPKLSDLCPEEAADLFKLVQRVDSFVQEYYNVSSTTISIQNGELAGQSIPHVHVHVLPRRPGDFQDNDDVYRELQSHDKETSGWRTEEEMIAEASLFREFLRR